MKRRDFLQQSLALAGVSCIPSFLPHLAQAQTASGQLIFIFLRGGADPLGLTTPTGADMTRLQSLRPTEAVTGALSYATNLSLHPQLAPLINDATIRARLNFVLHVGSINETRSHFEQMARIESGVMTGSPKDGIFGRTANLLARNTFAISPAIPTSLLGTSPIVLQDPAKLQNGYSAYNLKPGLSFTRNQRLGMYMKASTEAGDATVDSIARKANAQYDLIDNTPVTLATLVSRHGYVNSQFGQRLATAAEMLASAANPLVVAVNGDHDWDTHNAQDTNNFSYNSFATKVDDVAKNLLALKNDLVARGKWATTAVVIMSEFGRTVKENANKGTDHGRGGLMMLMGGRIRPFSDSIYTGVRRWTIPTTVDSSTALNVNYDYRNVLAEVLQKNCGVSQANLQTVFFNQLNFTQYLNVI